MHYKHLDMFKTCGTIFYIIINFGLLFAFAGGQNQSSADHPGGSLQPAIFLLATPNLVTSRLSLRSIESQTTPAPLACPPPRRIWNGYWKLHSSHCADKSHHCELQEGTNVVPGTHLVYFCNKGYQRTDNADVICTMKGTWLVHPQCKKIECKGFDIPLRANCSREGRWTSCALSVLPGTQAELSCRMTYHQDDSFGGANSVTCNPKGEWQPKPIRCISDPFQCPPQLIRCNGLCVNRIAVCDGKIRCVNEPLPECSVCLKNQFRCGTGQCIDELSVCNGAKDCLDNSDESATACGLNRSLSTSGSRRDQFFIHESTTPGPSICPVPPGIQNGYWKLHSSQCPSNNDHCEPQEGMKMVPGTHLVYFCNYGYQLTEVGGVHCTVGGRWTDIPQCKEIRCKALDTSSTRADCSLNGEWTSCATPVLPRTQAELSCRTSYRQEDSVSQRNLVTCNSQGQWQPEPIKCIPVCGIKPPKYVKPFIVGGQTPIITDFPWHATIYETSRNSNEKKFICGATIITDNLLITAAHCVYDEGTKKPNNPSKFVIATGNFFRDYDYVYPPPIVVRKAQVKNIYMNCIYQGLNGNYDRDIAILQIEPSINFTSYSAPICLDTNPRNLAINLGTNGVVVGFGRTAEGPVSSILQELSVPVVPTNVCIRDSKEVNFQRFVTADKFCAGYKNGSSVCDGDSGGGLTFETNNLWYIRGIVSSGLGTITTGGTRICDNTQYAIYTEISSHISWIRDIMWKVEHGEMIPECSARPRRRRSHSN